MQPTVAVTGRAEQRIQAGHLWIYKSDVLDVQAAPGDTVTVLGARGRPLGQALYSDRSQIALRLLSHGAEPADAALWRRRLEGAIAFRAVAGDRCDCLPPRPRRGDLLPSLIVDRYGDYLVLQSLSQGVERLLPTITGLLVDLLAPRGILARNDVKVRLLEGLDSRVEVLHGEVPATIPVREGPVEYQVDPWKGQKTGLFLDQRENREAAAAYARGRLLDCFSYNGGFAMRLAPRCDEVSRWTSPPTPWRESRRTPPGTACEHRGARGERLRRTAAARARRRAVRHDRAGPAGVRQEQGVGAESASPATATSTCARCAC